jgi:hypothetical protein
MNQFRREPVSSKTEELERTLLESIQLAKQKLSRFEQLESNSRLDKSADKKPAPLSDSTAFLASAGKSV